MKAVKDISFGADFGLAAFGDGGGDGGGGDKRFFGEMGLGLGGLKKYA